MKIIVDMLYNNRPPRIYKVYAPTIRSERTGLLVINEDVQMHEIPKNRICEEDSQAVRSS